MDQCLLTSLVFSQISTNCSEMISSKTFSETQTSCIRCERLGECNTITFLRDHYPLKLINPKTSDKYAVIYMLTYGGGLISGDSILLNVHILKGCTLSILGPASTKVYKQIDSLIASQCVNAIIETESLLLMLPEPICCFANSSFEQTQKIEIQAGGSLCLLDWITSGRYSVNERWQFNSFASNVRIFYNNNLFVTDRWLLQDGEISIAEKMNKFNCYANIILIGPRTALIMEQVNILHHHILIRKCDSLQDFIFTVSPVKERFGTSGMIIRAIATETNLIRDFVKEILRPVVDEIGSYFSRA